MAHELTFTNGKAEMAYIGETPWHGHGQRLTDGATIETWQAEAGMDWRILRASVRYATARDMLPESYRKMEDKVVLFRSDTGAALGVVSESYKIVQPAETLEFFRDLVASQGYVLETAGNLFGGARFWALARTGTESTIGKGDRIKQFLLLSTSADGTLATTARDTAVRVVCNNTLQLSHGAKSNGIVKVTHRSTFDAAAVKRELGVTGPDGFESAMESFRAMAATPLQDLDILNATGNLIIPGYGEMTVKEQADAIEKSKPARSIAGLVLNNTAKGADMAGRTVWGWLNGVTEHVDHHARAQSTGNRLSSAWFGPGAALKQRAAQMAVVMATTGGSAAPHYRDAFVSDAGPDDNGGGGLLDSILADAGAK